MIDLDSIKNPNEREFFRRKMMEILEKNTHNSQTLVLVVKILVCDSHDEIYWSVVQNRTDTSLIGPQTLEK